MASKVNEDARLQNLPGRKSFTLNMNMVSADPRLSPCIDLTQTSVIFTSNRVNRPITDYISDKRANSLVIREQIPFRMIQMLSTMLQDQLH